MTHPSFSRLHAPPGRQRNKKKRLTETDTQRKPGPLNRVGDTAMHTYDKVSAEMWVEVTPQEIHFTTLFDEIVFATEGETISYRAHTPDQSGPLHALFDEMCQRFENLHLVQSDS